MNFKAEAAVVDDDPAIEQIIKISTGLSSVSYSRASVFMKNICRLRPFAVFLDVNLEGAESGLSYLAPIKQALPRTSVFLVTGEKSIHRTVTNFRHYVDDLFLKPLDPGEMNQRYRTHVHQWAEKARASGLVLGDVSFCKEKGLLMGPEKTVLLKDDAAKIIAALMKERIVDSRSFLSGPGDLEDATQGTGWTVQHFRNALQEARMAMRDVTRNVEIDFKRNCALSLAVL